MALSDRIVVMHAGKVLQTGAPEEIYRRPLCREVAAFFGSPNLLAATVVSASRPDGTCYVAVRGEGWQGICRAAEPFAAGLSVLVMIRPEDVRIVAPGSAAEDQHVVWNGKVVDTIFRGPRRSVAIDVDGRRFNVEAPSLKSVSPGEHVTLTALAGQAWVIRA